MVAYLIVYVEVLGERVASGWAGAIVGGGVEEDAIGGLVGRTLRHFSWWWW